MSSFKINGGNYIKCRFGDEQRKPEPSPINAEQSHEQETVPVRRQVRQRLNQVLRLDSQLTAFCLDFFPEVARQFSSGMNRDQMVNLLITLEDADQILFRLSFMKPT